MRNEMTRSQISLGGTKVHADASKRKAVSYKRLRELETQFQAEVEELFALGEQSEQPEVPDGLIETSRRAFRGKNRVISANGTHTRRITVVFKTLRHRFENSTGSLFCAMLLCGRRIATNEIRGESSILRRRRDDSPPFIFL